ncbi:hypothetical protein HCN44_008337 [Aphidius gifuensis]|uniref:Ribosomal RNA large subunit methyltransferase K/L-like methyltransferase domain-containing protein n=1 Tax=Aphidius gifuensis TaxID=684658 RepID=A0A834XNI1_APHGI|nr:THUMP domain-containing protein 3-like [Aphidius gifuensis]KAF7989663.1 hypothetical protein HCN44_008337 [Aphidius gifuensis]
MTTKVTTELEKLFDLSSQNDDIFTVCLTVDTGLEWQAVDECKLKICDNLRAFKDRGKIYFNVAFEDFPKILKLRSIDNVHIVGDVRYLEFDPENAELNLQRVIDSSHNYKQLKKCLNAWKSITKYPGKLYPTHQEYESAVSQYNVKKEENKNLIVEEKRGSRKRGCDPSLAKEDSILSYRVTCERNGKHTFDSSKIATIIGGELQDQYHWIVDLTSYQLEILSRVNNSEMILLLRVTNESLHRRNITYFGPTTLRATVAYNLISLAEPKPGEIIIDPMCGGGSIPIEAAIEFPECYILAGDNHDKAIERSRLNFDALNKSFKSNLIQWNVAYLPFKDSSIDVFVTDMPFGKRSGLKSDNRIFYKKYLIELARVVKLKHGRLVLLTYDRRSITIALQATQDLFKQKKTLGVNMGGLPAACYVLKRTNLTFEQFQTTINNKTTKNKTNSSSGD